MPGKFLIVALALITIITLPAAAQGVLYVEGDMVGIGIDTPQKLLHVTDSSGNTQVLVEDTSSSAAARELFVLENYGGVKFAMINNLNGSQWNFEAQANFNIDLRDQPGKELQLQGDGDLIISGSLTTASSTVPDYVFSPNYDLLPLDDLEKFIARERHLPNIPSAEDVAAAGGQVNLSQLQMSLLEKIEELTLYTLAQQREIDALKTKLEELSAEE